MIIQGDCLEIMPTLEAESVDAVVTDPPYGLSFMGKDWDHGIPGKHFWQAALRVAKPGAYLLAFGGTRTFHRLAVAIEDAGWEIRDTIMWVYGSGFPKSHDVSKAIDKAAGEEREVVGVSSGPNNSKYDGERYSQKRETRFGVVQDQPESTAPATDAARQWQGWGTALKPAWEPIIVARKPLEGTVAANVLKYGTGGLNIDGCRVGVGNRRMCGTTDKSGESSYILGGRKETRTEQGRWPANLIHDGSEEVVGLFPQSSITGDRKIKNRIQQEAVSTPFTRSQDAPEYTDSGSVSRFFYCAKASRQDRNNGCEELEARTWQEQGYRDNETTHLSPRAGAGRTSLSRNHHPTVKPTDLMRYLCRLVTPPGGTILDPFMGSGSTGKAAGLEGFEFIGIELNLEYCQMAERRIEAVKLPLMEMMA